MFWKKFNKTFVHLVSFLWTTSIRLRSLPKSCSNPSSSKVPFLTLPTMQQSSLTNGEQWACAQTSHWKRLFIQWAKIQQKSLKHPSFSWFCYPTYMHIMQITWPTIQHSCSSSPMGRGGQPCSPKTVGVNLYLATIRS